MSLTAPKIRLYLVALAALCAWLIPAIVSAAVAPPAADLYEAHGFSNVMEPDDRLILIRYSLPLADWQFDGVTATTTSPSGVAFMKNSTCTEVTSLSTTNPLPDSCYTSVLSGMITQSFHNGPASATTTTLGLRTLPRIGDGLSGLYIRAGHNLAPAGSEESQTYETCIVGATTVFPGSVPTFNSGISTCLVPIWHPTTLVTEKTALTQTLVQMTLNIQEEMNEPMNKFVAEDTITENGIVFGREAFSMVTTAAPSAFYTGVHAPFGDFNTTPEETEFEKEALAGAKTSVIYEAVRDSGLWYFGIDTNIAGMLAGLVLAMIVMIATAIYTRGMTYPAILGFLTLLVATFLGLVPVAAMWVAMAGFLTLGATVVFRKFPQ